MAIFVFSTYIADTTVAGRSSSSKLSVDMDRCEETARDPRRGCA